MKLRKRLTVNGENVPLVDEDVRLELHAPGRGMFRVQSTAALSGFVRLYLGYSNQDADQLFFTGYVEKSVTVDAQTQRLMCRELTALLDAHMPVFLRHPTLADVLAAYAERTGLSFILGQGAYAARDVASFCALGSGHQGMDSIGAVFGIARYVWLQQGDDKVFVGSWDDSRWATRPVTVEERWFSACNADGGKTLPVLPALRPGVLLNGEYVRALQLQGENMVVTCAKQLEK
ncbi:hypothetical protein LN040_03825 [Desulfovibrio subterraneus]|uniref:hypothetical protein n=1 Tax=Desulfovibrio subterraneus TaxID=2718620 RepID=UPI0022B905E3|nr:hypothetical protein [Desulfovibrio subterraneus]WBF68242.1 hypothetical protein LN040_03825 [Desulfovibrio subterraneus]